MTVNKSLGFCIIACVCVLAFAATPVLAHKSYIDDMDFHFGTDGFTIENINIDYNDNDDLTVKNLDDKTSFTITSGFDLYVNEKLIETTPEQKKLVKEMYLSVDTISDEAKEIGWTGIKIGAEGAKLGIQAILSLFKLFSPNYDIDDLEDEIERKAVKLEEKAEQIEVKADKLEEMVRDLQELTDRMKAKIPALKELDWF